MPQASTSLQHRKSPLAAPDAQLRLLESTQTPKRFAVAMGEHGLSRLHANGLEILQVNLGKTCNMTCRHCHVNAGPDRRETMTRETIDLCLRALRDARLSILDLTGGAPEMNPDFRYLVAEARQLGAHVIDRCNLTILLAAGYEDLPEFLAKHRVEVVASLPCYLQENTDSQRGEGAYGQSIEALRRLNALGYGKSGEHRLTLVYNPIGPALPPPQKKLESRYREHLLREYGIEFDRLFTITNMPISRFLEGLLQANQYESYMRTLVDAFNPKALAGVMCRQMISVGWDGALYDCDFNQMLELPTARGVPRHIRDFQIEHLTDRPIAVGQHCFGCTAAAGSGCLGAIEAD